MAVQIYVPLMLADQIFKSPGNKLHVGRLIYSPNFFFEMEQQRIVRMRMDILSIRIQLRHALQ